MPSRHIHRALALAALVGLSAAATMCIGGHAARADNILVFGQTAPGNELTATANAAGTQTNLSANGIPVTITQLFGTATPVNAELFFHASSAGIATPLGAGATQKFTGSLQIVDGPIDYLSAVFNDIVLGGGASGVLSSGDPPDTIVFNSNVIPAADLLVPLGISLAFANVTPAVNIDNETFGSFTSSIGGDFSSNAVVIPTTEPAGLAVLGVGLFGLWMSRTRRQRRGQGPNLCSTGPSLAAT